MFFILKRNFNQLVRRDRVTGLFVQKKQRKPDRFNLNQIHNNSKLFDITRNPLDALTLNEYISVLYRITQINQAIDRSTFYGSLEIIQSIKKRLSDVQDENPLLGTLAYCLRKLDIYNDLNIWVNIKDYIVANVYDDEYDEIYNLIVGFDKLKSKLKEDWQVELYLKTYYGLQYNIKKSIQQGKYTLEQIKSLLFFLNQNEFNLNQEVLEEFEYQTMKIIFKSINVNKLEGVLLKDLCFIGYQLSKGNSKSEKLFNFTKDKFQIALQQKDETQILVDVGLSHYIKWHNFYYNDQQEEQNQIIQGKFRLLEYILDRILNVNFTKSLKTILALYEYLEKININDSIYKNKLNQYLFKIDTNKPCKLDNIQNLLQILLNINVQQNKEGLDKETLVFLDNLKIKKLQEFNPAQLFFYLNYLEEEVFKFQKNLLDSFPNFFYQLPEQIYQQSNLLDFDDVCYFYVIFILNSHIVSRRTSNSQSDFHGNVNNIKQHIKFVTLRRGFKIDMNSHFHKLLNVVDLADFFDGGEN